MKQRVVLSPESQLRISQTCMKTKVAVLCMGLLLCSAVASRANSIVTFQVDMTNMIALASFDPLSQSVTVRGSFNGWGTPTALALTNNPNGPTPTVYSGTVDIPTNGIVVSYKYVVEPGTQYESVRSGGGHNRLINLPTASGASMSAPLVDYSDNTLITGDITTTVTFQVNMAQQINVGAFDPNTSTVAARGYFNGWATSNMTNDPSIYTTNQFGLVSSNVYTVAVDVTGAPGQTVDYKYYIDTGANWESPPPGIGDPADNNNRFFNLPASAAALPILYFNDAAYAPVATNDTVFQVDMTAQVVAGNFDPSTGTVEVRGNFNSWGTPQILATNNPNAANTNIYSVVIRLSDGVGAREQYKFWSTVPQNGGWETMADNRSMQIVAGTSQTLPLVYFSNINPNDLLPADTLVTFNLNMTNAVGNDSHAFDPDAGDWVAINGIPSFATWDGSLPQLTRVGSSFIYTIQLTLPKGSPVMQTYKFGINSVDDEAGAGQNHVRYVRTAGTYTMPLDKFGTQYVEPSIGQLAIGPASGGHVPISWLGRPGAHLQIKADLGSGSWQDLNNTDGANWTSGHASPDGFVSTTNYPTSAAKTFLRIIQQ